MHARKIVNGLLVGCLSCLHGKRAELIRAAVWGALNGGRLSLSQLARSLSSEGAMRHRIKRIDRLLGNAAIYGARLCIYQAVAAHWLAGVRQLLIVVDWSDVTPDQKWHLLRASIAVDGRSVTLYEEIHPQRKYGDRGVHRRFLAKLAKLLPEGCMPIIMTDAGFRSTWFDLVAQRRWPWIGRIRGKDMVCTAGEAWRRCTEVYAEASAQVKVFADAQYVRSHPTPCRLILVKRQAKGRFRRTLQGKNSRAHRSLKAARSGREPWLPASSPGLGHLEPEAIVSLYAQRMRIEQSFRDLKNERGGLGLSASRSRSGKRLEILLLIGHLASWLLRLIGECAEQRQMQLQFQSVPRLKHKEISVMTLARRVIDAGGTWFRRLPIADALPLIRQQAMVAAQGGKI
ncbi:MAG: IS4 family transposase [Azonexus sp.]